MRIMLLNYEKLLKECCFSMEPQEHGVVFGEELYFNNALMASIPAHPFMKEVIKRVFEYVPGVNISTPGQRIMEVLNSTGPLLLVKLYKSYPEKDNVFLIPSKYVSPFTDKEVKLIMQGFESEELENKLNEAYSIHYFFNGWVK